MEANTVVLPIEKYDYFMENERKLQTIINSKDKICIYRSGYSKDFTLLNDDAYLTLIKQEISSMEHNIKVLEIELGIAKNQNRAVCEDVKFSVLNKSRIFRLLNKFIFKVK